MRKIASVRALVALDAYAKDYPLNVKAWYAYRTLQLELYVRSVRALKNALTERAEATTAPKRLQLSGDVVRAIDALTGATHRLRRRYPLAVWAIYHHLATTQQTAWEHLRSEAAYLPEREALYSLRRELQASEYAFHSSTDEDQAKAWGLDLPEGVARA